MKLVARLASVLPALVLALLAVLGALSCSKGSSPAGTGQNVTAVVHVRGVSGYSSDSVTIHAGETVEWIWDVAGHSVTSCPIVGGVPACVSDGNFDSGILAAGATFYMTFPATGTYGYHCSAATDCIASFESAVVVVQ